MSGANRQHLWPLYRIKSTVDFTIEGISEEIKAFILSSRVAQDSKQDSISQGMELLSRVEGLVVLLARLNNVGVSSKMGKLRIKVVKVTKWSGSILNDERTMKQLDTVELALGKPAMKKVDPESQGD